MSKNLVSKNKVVSLAYRLTDGDANPLESYTIDAPYDYLHGAGQILLSLEKALEGKKPGDRISLIIGVEDAYGEYKDDLVTIVDKAHFANEFSLKVGMKFATKGPKAEDVIVEIVSVDDHSVTLDGNHPLAGIDLIFDIEVIAVRPATSEEIEQAMANMPKEQIH